MEEKQEKWFVNESGNLRENLRSIMNSLSYAQRDSLLEMLKQDKKEREKPSFESLFWDEKAVLEDLKKNYITIDWDKEYLWHKWIVVHIKLPAVADFEWFETDYFISNRRVEQRDLVFMKERKNLYPREKIGKLLEAISRYMRAYWIEMDANVDFDCDIDQLECHTSTLLGKYFKLDSTYWVRGDKEYEPNYFHTLDYHEGISCSPDGLPDDIFAHLLMEFSN